MIQVYDFETLSNYTLAVFYNVKKKQYKEFQWYKTINDTDAFCKHIISKDTFVGFNSSDFDDQVAEHIMINRDMLANMTGEQAAQNIYSFVQGLISVQDFNELPPYSRWDRTIRSLDLYKINHYNNPARRTSLKALQIAMKLPQVLDMPIDHHQTVTDEDIPTIIEYCKNDVESTYQFYLKNSEGIKLRQELGEEYKRDFLASPDSSLGETLFAIMLQEEMRIPMKQLRQLRTHRGPIPIKDILLPYIKFNTPEFQNLYQFFYDTTIVSPDQTVAYELNIPGMEVHYGQGGVHGCIQPGIYVEDEEYEILDMDISSMYPNISIANGFRPKHLGPTFNKIYAEVYETRKSMPKGSALNTAYKLMLNSIFGKSNSVHSYLYDVAYLYKITISGQLLISMLLESLLDCGQVLQVNTDGITIRHRKEDLPKIKRICEEWEELTKLNLEYVNYHKMVIRDVNNYLAVGVDGKVKQKGCFVSEPELHKNPSFMVIPKALQEYYVNGTDVKEYINNHKDMYDFFGRQKFIGTAGGYIEHLIGTTIVREPMQKNVRYYVSLTGKPMMKEIMRTDKATGTKKLWTEVVNAGRLVVVANHVTDPDSLLADVDRSFYITETYKIISAIEPHKKETHEILTLF